MRILRANYPNALKMFEASILGIYKWVNRLHSGLHEHLLCRSVIWHRPYDRWVILRRYNWRPSTRRTVRGEGVPTTFEVSKQKMGVRHSIAFCLSNTFVLMRHKTSWKSQQPWYFPKGRAQQSGKKSFIPVVCWVVDRHTRSETPVDTCNFMPCRLLELTPCCTAFVDLVLYAAEIMFGFDLILIPENHPVHYLFLRQ